MNDIQVYASPSPFSNKRMSRIFPHGKTIAEIVDDVFPEQYRLEDIGAVVLIGGDVIPKEEWHRRPDPGLMNIRIVPTGGGGGGGKKNPVATLLSIAVLIAAPYISAAILGPGIIASTQAGALLISRGLTAVIGVVGRLAISALAPPPKPSSVGFSGNTSVSNPAESPTQFIEGAKNSLNPFGVIPVNLGTNRMFPLQAARPFTETQDSDQYVRQLFTYGYGEEVTLDAIKIGETLITSFDDFDIEHKIQGNLHTGTDLYSDDVFQEDLSVLLTFAGGFTSRTTQQDIDEAIIDLTFAKGLTRYTSDGARAETSVEYRVEYRETGTSGPFTLVEQTTVTAAQKEAFRKSVRIVFPSNGQYDVQVKRVTADSTSDQTFDELYFTAVKSITYQNPVNLTGINGTAVRIKATDQLNGVLDQLNALVSTHIPDYDSGSGTWITRATSNPASIYRYVLQGAPNAKALADSKINITDLEAWHTYCETESYTYNRVIDFEASVDQILRDVASAGAASPAIVDGKRTVAIDQEKSDIVQVITPRNSWGYSGEIIYPELPHAFRVQFRNADKGYQQDERIVYDDGYNVNNATVFEVLELQSCTNADLAFKTARRHLAAARLRPETHTWQMDVENLIAVRGDRVVLEHDAPIIGIGDGRVASVTTDGGSPELVTGFTIDDTVAIPDSSTYYVRIRLADGTMLYKELVTSVGNTSSFTFATPFAVADTPAIGDLCAFFEAGGELDLIITRIEPAEDMTARITAINYAQPDINNAENSAIPAFDSKVTTPLELIRPLPPTLVESQSDESAMLLNSDGSYIARAIFTIENPNEDTVQTEVKVRISGTNVFTTVSVLELTPDRVVIAGLEDGNRYDVYIRYRRPGASVKSLPLTINNYEFIGASTTPADVSGFKINVVGESAIFKWDKNTELDIDHYVLRYSPLYTGATYGTASLLEAQVFENRFTTVFRGGTYFIKAVDILGNESANASTIITFDPGAIANAEAQINEEDDFGGTFSNTELLTGPSLILTDTASDGYYSFQESVNLDGIFPCIVSATIVANAYDTSGGSNDVFDFTDVFAVDDVFGIGSDAWEVELQFRTTDDAAASPIVWSDWQVFESGIIEFYAIEFRIKLVSLQASISPEVTTLQVNVDMPDRIERGEDLTVAVAGDTITFDPEFRATPAVAITIQDGETDDKIEFTSKTSSGFTFKVYNDTAAAYVQRSYDYIASGYGRKNT